MAFRFDIPLDKINKSGKPVIVRNNGGYVIAGRDNLIEGRNLSEAFSILEAETVLWRQEEAERIAPSIDVDIRERKRPASFFSELSWRVDELLTPRGRRL